MITLLKQCFTALRILNTLGLLLVSTHAEATHFFSIDQLDLMQTQPGVHHGKPFPALVSGESCHLVASGYCWEARVR